MKNNFISLVFVLSLVTIVSCKSGKKESADIKDKFVGSWSDCNNPGVKIDITKTGSEYTIKSQGIDGFENTPGPEPVKFSKEGENILNSNVETRLTYNPATNNMAVSTSHEDHIFCKN